MKKAAIRYLCTYMSIALAILILLMPIYSASIKNAKTRLRLEAANIAESNLSHLSSEIQSIGILAKTVQNDQNYIKLGYSHLDRIEVMTSTSLRKTLSNLLAPNDFVKDVLIIYNDADSVTTREMAYGRSDFFYNDMCFGIEGLSYAGFRDLLFNSSDRVIGPMSMTYKNNTICGMLNVYRTVRAGKCVSAIAVLVDLSKIEKIIVSENESLFGEVRLQLSDVEVLNERFCESVAADAIEIADKTNNLKLFVSLNDQMVYNSVVPILRMLIVYTLLAFLLALSLAFYYVVKVYRPLNRYLKQLPEGSDKSDVQYAHLMSGSIVDLLIHRDNLEKKLAQLRAQRRADAIGDLMHNLPISDMEAVDELKDDSLINGSYSAARLYLRINNELQMADVKRVYKNAAATLHERYRDVCIPYLGNTLFCAVIPVEPDEVEMNCVLLERIASNLELTTGCRVAFCVSAVHRGIDGLRDAYNECSILMRSAGSIGSAVLRMDMLQRKSVANLSFEPELLSNMLEASETAVLRARLESYNERITELFSYNPGRAEQLYYNIMDTCDAALSKYGIKPEMQHPEASKETNIEAVAAHIEQYAIYVHDAISNAKHESSKKTEAVLEYIKTHYTDPDISLTTLAATFFYSEGYIYQLIKKCTGLSYTDYLSGLRMEKAVTLLTETSLSANKVAEMCGFTNVNTFYKAFKKKYGVAPGQYKARQGE